MQREDDAETQKERCVMTEAENGVMHLQARECQGSLGATGCWKGQGRIFPKACRENLALLTP